MHFWSPNNSCTVQYKEEVCDKVEFLYLGRGLAGWGVLPNSEILFKYTTF